MVNIRKLRKPQSTKVLRDRFELLIYQMVEGYSMEQVHFETALYYRDFIGAGFDPVIIAQLLSPEDLWDNYEELSSLGPYVVNVYDIIPDLDSLFIEEHWNEAIERGVSPDILADHLDSIIDVNDVAKFLELGVSPGKVYELSQWLLSVSEDSPNEALAIFALLCKYGLPLAKVKEWLSSHLTDSMLSSIVEYDRWADFGIKPEDYATEWVYVYGASYFAPRGLYSLPEVINISFLLKHTLMRDILGAIRPGHLRDFLQGEFLAAGGDIDDFAQKYIDEIGYSSDFDGFTTMLDLVLAGATVVDTERLIGVIDLSMLDDFTRSNYWIELSSVGADARLVKLFYV